MLCFHRLTELLLYKTPGKTFQYSNNLFSLADPAATENTAIIYLTCYTSEAAKCRI